MKSKRLRILAIVALFFLLAILLVVLRLGMFSFLLLAISAVIGTTLFLISDISHKVGRIYPKRRQVVDTTKQRRVSRILSILFFVFFAQTLLILSPGSYFKPLGYYLLVSLCGGLIAADILLVTNRIDVSLNLAKSFLLASNIFLSSQLIFPYGIGGADSITHLQLIIHPMIGTGHIPSVEFTYSNFPIHHILVAMGSLVLRVDPSVSYYCLGPVALCSGVLFAFLLGRWLLDHRAGLLAALLFPASSYILYWASHPAQLTYVLPLISLLILIVLYLHKNRFLGLKAIVPILILSIVFSHPYSSVVVLIILLSVMTVEWTLARRKKALAWNIHYVFLIFLGVLFLHWIYYSSLFGNAVSYAKTYYEAIVGESLATFPTIYDYYPLSTILLNTIGVSLVIMLSMAGFFFFLSKSSLRKTIVVGYAIGLTVVAFIGMFLQLVYILPNRIFLYLEAFALIFLFAGGVRYFGLDVVRRGYRILRGALLVLIITVVFFFSTSSTIAGFETSLFTDDQPNVKLYDTASERQSVTWTNEHLSMEDVHDIYVGRSFSAYSAYWISKESIADGKNVSGIPLNATYDVDVQSIRNNSVILFNTFDIEFGFSIGQRVGGRYGQGVYLRFEEDVLRQFDGFHKCYDNGRVFLFMTT